MSQNSIETRMLPGPATSLSSELTIAPSVSFPLEARQEFADIFGSIERDRSKSESSAREDVQKQSRHDSMDEPAEDDAMENKETVFGRASRVSFASGEGKPVQQSGKSEKTALVDYKKKPDQDNRSEKPQSPIVKMLHGSQSGTFVKSSIGFQTTVEISDARSHGLIAASAEKGKTETVKHSKLVQVTPGKETSEDKTTPGPTLTKAMEKMPAHDKKGTEQASPRATKTLPEPAPSKTLSESDKVSKQQSVSLSQNPQKPPGMNLESSMKETGPNTVSSVQEQKPERAPNNAPKAVSDPQQSLTEDKHSEKKSPVSAKVSHPRQNPVVSPSGQSISSEARAVADVAEKHFQQLQQSIGTKSAVHELEKGTEPMKLENTKAKESTTRPEQGFLKEASDPSQVQRHGVVQSRAESSVLHHAAAQGGAHHQGQQNEGRQSREKQQQRMVDSAQLRNTSNAAQQSQFFDKAMGAQLSARVIHQILNHIDRLRDNEKSRIRVSLGGEGSERLSVDIEIRADGVHTTFEGESSALAQLKEEWADLSRRAAKRGVRLIAPKYLSYASPAMEQSPIPGAGIPEDRSQSVIQHKNNQPVRPVIQTAAAGSSSPVLTWA